MHTGARRELGPPPHFNPSGPRLGFGAWAVGGAGWGPVGAVGEREAAVRRALERGVTLFDTAPAYGDGESERVLGRALGAARDRITLATKVGPRDDPRSSLEASLRRLQTEYVDLIQLHETVEGWEQRLAALGRLRDEGKARLVGLCNATHHELARAAAITPIATYQGPYNLFDRDVEARELPLSRARGIAFLAYRPLASGLLSGKHASPPAFEDGDHRSRIYWFKGKEFERRRVVLERLRPLAERWGTSLAGLALGWVLARPGVSVVLAGARTAAQVDENVAAGERPLAPEVVAEIDAAVADVFRLPAAGSRALDLAGEWGERERFIVGQLDGRRTAENIAAAWTDRGETPMIAAQVKVFVDQLADRGLVEY